jgi:hypothetical protein
VTMSGIEEDGTGSDDLIEDGYEAGAQHIAPVARTCSRSLPRCAQVLRVGCVVLHEVGDLHRVDEGPWRGKTGSRGFLTWVFPRERLCEGIARTCT